MNRITLILAIAAAIAAPMASALEQTYIIEEGFAGYVGFEDTSIFNEGTASAGGNGVLTTGRNMMGMLRRTLLRADLGIIPTNATILDVKLEMVVENAPNTNTPNTYSLHPLTVSWGEGSTLSTIGGGGQGGPSSTGDATWLSRFHNTTAWTTSGGDYSATATASASIAGIGSTATWDTAAMITDVQTWVTTPATNFGWIMIGPEDTNQRLRHFFSSEAVSSRPRLTITAEVDDPVPALTMPTVLATAMALIGAAFIYRRKQRAQR